MKPLIINAAVVGGELSRKDTPHLPITPEEIAGEVLSCRKEGACMVHLHARDEKGSPKHEINIFKILVEEIEKKCKKENLDPPILQFSTGGSIGMGLNERLAPLSLKPELASLTTGSVNFGPDIFENNQKTMETIAKKLNDLQIGVELEIFDAGMMDNARSLEKNGFLKAPLHFNFVLGVPGGLSGDPENLFFLRNKLLPEETWSVAGMGRHQLPLAALSIVLGGHVRVGLEDNIFYRKGELSKGNAPLVARIGRLAQELDREIANPTQARRILHLEG